MSAWELLAEYTDSRHVSFELDVLWTTDAGVDVVQMLQERAIPTDMGGGQIYWSPILDAARRRETALSHEHHRSHHSM
ncbi:hypothetical protein ACT3UD_03990 [Glutamicibacter sp. 287]|uniref:hypothetical protein n=1 Tax=Glutamicibacter sp. 287 TaxID=3457732 RepID=UPI00403351F3